MDTVASANSGGEAALNIGNSLRSLRRRGKGWLWAMATVASVPLIAAPGDTVNVYSWANYVDEETVPSFAAQTGIKVHYDVMDSNGVLEGKLLTGKSGYDVVVPSLNSFGPQIEGGLYQPIPKAKLKNYGNLDPAVMKQLNVVDPGNVYGVPFMWGTTGIAFNVEKIKARMPDAPLDSWGLIFDPAIVAKFKDCGVVLVDGSDDVLESALIYLGGDPNSEKAEDLQAATEVVRRIQPFVRYFHSTSYIDDLANGEICLALGWSGDVYGAMRSARAGVKIEYRIPIQGAIMWIDSMAIPKDAPHPEAAAKWIDYLLDPAVVARISNTSFYANANEASLPLLDPAVRDNPVIYPSKAVLERLIAVKPQSQNFVRMRNRAWTEVKAGG